MSYPLGKNLMVGGGGAASTPPLYVRGLNCIIGPQKDATHVVAKIKPEKKTCTIRTLTSAIPVQHSDQLT